MKYIINRKLIVMTFAATASLLLLTNCEREISDDAKLATYPSTANIFTDDPVGLTDAFFESYDPASGANPTGFNVDNNEAYVGKKSIRIDVPAPNDPNGGYIGGVFRDRGAGRNLTGYDALTFWVKASTTTTMGTAGFGVDFAQNKYSSTIDNIQLSTTWRKVIIPIPDPSKLTQEKGLFSFSAGTQDTDGIGYTIWIDELRFEKLGNIRLLNPYIFNGQDKTVDGFVGSTQTFTEVGALFNLANGQNIKVNASPAYFNFSSTNTELTGPFKLTSTGQMYTEIVGSTGSATITASLGENMAQGSLKVNAVGDFSFAPTPTRPAGNVTSIFSNRYTNNPVDFFNGFWQPWQTTQSAHFTIANDDILRYTNFNFVGIQFANPTVNLSNKPNLHFDMYLPNAVPANFDFLVTIEDFGPDNVDGGSDDTRVQLFVRNSSNIVSKKWMSFDFSLNNLANKNNVGLIIFENINGSSLRELYIDNLYFYNN